MKGRIIDQDVVVKPGRCPHFYQMLMVPLGAEHHVPGNIHQYGESYTYQFVKGRQAAVDDVPRILDVCTSYLWKVIKTWQLLPDINKFYYLAYIDSLLAQQTPALLNDDVFVVRQAQRLIAGSTLLQARLVHGDLTLENIIIQDDKNIVFIDPGDSRRCYTPALDRGKLLQSVVMRWEERDGAFAVVGMHNDAMKHLIPWVTPNPWPDWATELDWAFLVTHWLRLVRHWPGQPIHAGFKTLAKLRPVRI